MHQIRIRSTESGHATYRTIKLLSAFEYRKHIKFETVIGTGILKNEHIME